ncbi:lamin tail domain-containing protein [Neolewinella litorea]|uniref:Lamin tail domain-containing protein n=1 Tax=Neolewinella litorea TaxID=2562452 RepID=A0A4S4NSF1_9BACT|nr:lamin tail domain-containing protein [Neolewinella litorea]THH41381.1 lamin tail domain-containing protein [Neolewinella litorea]
MKVPVLALILLIACAPCVVAQSVLVTEIMVDPTPQIGLPNAEYVELFNPGNQPITLDDLSISTGGRAVTAGAGYPPLESGEYVVLVRQAFTAEFRALGARVLPLQLPALVNGGDEIILLLGADTIQHLRYTPDWYHDIDRDGGGYSLAYTGSGATDCSGHWRASTEAAGGSPGRANAVYGQPADRQPPALVSASLTPSGVDVSFDEPVAGSIFFTVDGLPVPSATSDGQNHHLPLASVERGRLYELVILPDYADCAGNYADREQRIPLLLADDPAAGELVINEILFNPVVGGHDYVELLNTSSSAFNLAGLQLYNRNSASRPKRVDTAFLLPPGGYVVLTADGEDLSARFANVDTAQVVEMRLPSLPNESGNLSLRLPDGAVLDAVDYHEDFHAEWLSSVEGVSLERIDPRSVLAGRDNWASAATASGYGTPTRPNSQNRSATLAAGELRIEAESTTFSPDGDGYEDRFILHYESPDPGYLANLQVFDLEGRRVVAPLRSNLLGTTGSLSWDGRRDDGGLAPPGPYIVVVETFAADGARQTHKMVAVVAGSR